MASGVLRISVLPGHLRPNSLVHSGDDVAVGELRKQQVMVTQGTEPSWLTKANDTIRFPSQLSHCIPRRNRNSHDDFPW